MKGNNRSAFAIVSVAICFAFFMFVLDAPLMAIVKFALAVGALAACGFTLSKLYGFENWGGMFLLRSKQGLDFIDRVSKKYPKAWQAAADIGMVIGYGSLAYFLMGKRKGGWKEKLPTFAIGSLLMVTLLNVVAPMSMAVIFALLSGGSEFASAGSKLNSSLAGVELFKYVYFVLMAVGGIALVTTLSIFTYCAMLLATIVPALFGGNFSAIAQTTPGGTPIIPGINLPLIEGIIALAIVLVVHEGMHGIVARLYKLPLKSAGLVFFGFLPFGAFVDIDEKKLFKAKKEQQNAVFVAGTAANFATAIIFMLLFFAFIYSIGDIRNSATGFIARVVGLTFALNFVVAAMNLVPLPLFDGYHIMRNGVRNETVAKVIAYAIGAAFLLALLPWIFR
ncbi:Peptidase family M50 [uncultured archaeon]|nr:Peptidase family M50 [uncultured archaeon]